MDAGARYPALRPLQLGPLRVANNLSLAPIAGGSTRPLRVIAHRYGAGLVYTELVSARGIVRQGLARNRRYIASAEAERPLALQLFGSEPEDFAGAIARLLDEPEAARFDAIDLNLGCPVPKVVRGGAGAALLREPEKVSAIARAAVAALEGSGRPLLAKMRIGYADGEDLACELALRLADAGVAGLAVHGRTRAQYYSGRADRAAIARVVAALAGPHPQLAVYGNGDIDGPAEAAAMLAETGCHGLMVGRAALGRPWIFAELIQGPDWQPPSLDERRAVMLEHARGLVELLGEAVAVRELRAALQPYVRGLEGATDWRRRCAQLETMDDVVALVAALGEG